MPKGIQGKLINSLEKLVLGKKRIAAQTIRIVILQILKRSSVINQKFYSSYQNSIFNLEVNYVTF